MKQIKAIQTRYKGYHFRSRLEARYAVLFDALGFDWEYEPEGFELPSGNYLPDFFIKLNNNELRSSKWPNAGYWVEIKGQDPTAEEVKKCVELSEMTGHKTWIFYGGLGRKSKASEAPSLYRRMTGVDDGVVFNSGTPELFKYKVNRMIDGVTSMINNQDAGQLYHSAPVWLCTDGDFTELFYDALALSRSARFEFGETPSPISFIEKESAKGNLTDDISLHLFQTLCIAAARDKNIGKDKVRRSIRMFGGPKTSDINPLDRNKVLAEIGGRYDIMGEQ